MRTLKSEKQPLLGKNYVTRNNTRATVKQHEHAAREELLKVVISVLSGPLLRHESVYKITRINIFAALEKEKPGIRNKRGLNLAAVEVTKLPL
jgi:hypothetical protein